VASASARLGALDLTSGHRSRAAEHHRVRTSFDRDQIMTFHRSSLAALIGFALHIPAPATFAAAADYVFEPVKVEVKNGKASDLAVKLIHKPTGKPVEGAVLFRTRLDMSPDKMETMTANHAALPSGEPGVYRFKADLTMAGP
jgi:hypothetical protein